MICSDTGTVSERKTQFSRQSGAGSVATWVFSSECCTELSILRGKQKAEESRTKLESLCRLLLVLFIEAFDLLHNGTVTYPCAFVKNYFTLQVLLLYLGRLQILI